MQNEKVKFSEFIVQSFTAFCVSFLACQTGFICAWPSYTVTNFSSNATVLATPMTTLEASLLGSLPNVGALAATPFCVHAFDTMGRKYATMFFGLPYVIAWTIISLTSNVTLVLLAICLAGVGIAGQNVAIIFVSEISHDSIRGGLTGCTVSFYFLGLLVSYILGAYLTYTQVIYTHLTLSVVAVLLIGLLPESPVFLVLLGKEKEAAKSISYYRRLEVTSKEVEAHIAKIKMQLYPKLGKMQLDGKEVGEASELVQKLDNNVPRKSESAWRFFIKSKSSQRILAHIFITTALTIMMGCVVLQVYAEPLFTEALPSMPASQCAIFLALDFFLASTVCVLTIDRCGRKSMLIATSVGSGICTLLLGSQLQYHWAPHWITALLIYVYSFIFTLGCAVIPYVLAAEAFLPEVTSLGNSAVLSCAWIFNFLTLVVFKPIMDYLGLGTLFYIFSIICFSGALYTSIFIPETKGLSPDAIQSLFLKKKKGTINLNE